LIASDFRNTKDELAATDKDITRTKAELNFTLDKEFEAPKGGLQLAVFEGQVSEIQMQKLDHEAKISGLEVKLDRAILKSEILRDELKKSSPPRYQNKKTKAKCEAAASRFFAEQAIFIR